MGLGMLTEPCPDRTRVPGVSKQACTMLLSNHLG